MLFYFSLSSFIFLVASDANQNVRGVFLHLLGDALGSVAVIISALLYVFKEQLHIDDKYIVYVDPALSLIIICLIIPSTVSLCKTLAD
jgi:zinc transporter 1